MLTPWYRTGSIYSADVGLCQESNDDGVGDFRGLIGGLGYRSRLGVRTSRPTPSAHRRAVPVATTPTTTNDVLRRWDCLVDFASMMHEANERLIRIMLEPRRQPDQRPASLAQSASADPSSRSATGMCGQSPSLRIGSKAWGSREEETGTFDDTAKRVYRHRFYASNPTSTRITRRCTRNPQNRPVVARQRHRRLPRRRRPSLIEPKTRAESSARPTSSSASCTESSTSIA
jgi:maltose alpha-D-glucosyltransferase / alpha-amylase